MRAIQSLVLVVALAQIIGSIGILRVIPNRYEAEHVALVRFIESGCTAATTRTLSAGTIRTCELCDVDLVVRPNCPPEPLDVVLVLLGYASPSGNDREISRRWIEAAIDALAMPENRHVQVGIVYVRKTSTIRLDLTNDEGDVKRMSRIEYVNAGSLPGDYPCFSCGFDLAARVLRDSEHKRSVIVYIGGMIDFPLIEPDDESFYLDWVRGAAVAKRAADKLVVGCPFSTPCKSYSTRPWWREATPGFYFEGPGPGRFADALEDLIPGPLPTSIESLVVDESVPNALDYVPDSAEPPPAFTDPPTGLLRWSFTAPITSGIPITLTYRVKPRDGITMPLSTTFASGQVALTDTARLSRLVPIPSSVLTVTGPCEAIATTTPTPTNLPEPTGTPRLTATPALVPTATMTPTPAPIFLPLLLHEHCDSRRARADVVLVIDASSSMQELAVPGSALTKLDAAIAAAQAFVDQLALDSGDQVAIVSFNAMARLEHALTADRDAIRFALSEIRTERQTCIVCGVSAAADELASDRTIKSNRAVMVLLTDGRSNPRPVSEAVTEAERLKADGAVIFTIGLGNELDDAALEHIASRPEYFYRAPKAEDLTSIYRAIAVEIPCPMESYWGRR